MRDKPLCGLIASTRGWLIVEKMEQQHLWVGGTSFIHNHLVHILTYKFLLCFMMLISLCNYLYECYVFIVLL
jgi:hypothetical protein